MNLYIQKQFQLSSIKIQQVIKQNKVRGFFCNLFSNALVLGLNYISVTSYLCNIKPHKINQNINEDKNIDYSNGMQYCKINVELQSQILLEIFTFLILKSPYFSVLLYVYPNFIQLIMRV